MRKLLVIFAMLFTGCMDMDPGPYIPPVQVQYVAENYEYCDPPDIICDVGSVCWVEPSWPSGTNQFCSPECNTDWDCAIDYNCYWGYVGGHCL